MTAITIDRQIAFFRKQMGLSQEELAKKLGVSNQAVSKWESAQCCPDISLLPQLGEIFGVSVDELLGRRPAEKTEGALLTLRQTANSLPEEEQHRFVLRSAAALHRAVLAGYMTAHSAAAPRREMEPEENDTWSYSCVDAPTIITVMRRGGVFFSDNGDPALSSADFSKIAELLKCFSDVKALRTAAALYKLTAPAEDLYTPAAQISESASLPEETVTACLQDVLAPLLKEKREEAGLSYRFGGEYRHIVPLLSLLSYAG